MWICVFNETDTHFWLRQDTGTMNRPLRLADCSPRISWVFATLCNPSAALSQTISSRRGPIYRARIYENTHKMGEENACVVK